MVTVGHPVRRERPRSAPPPKRAHGRPRRSRPTRRLPPSAQSRPRGHCQTTRVGPLGTRRHVLRRPKAQTRAATAGVVSRLMRATRSRAPRPATHVRRSHPGGDSRRGPAPEATRPRMRAGVVVGLSRKMVSSPHRFERSAQAAGLLTANRDEHAVDHLPPRLGREAVEPQPDEGVRVRESNDRGADGPLARERPSRAVAASVVPDARARSEARWITGPSRAGPRTGTPTSRMSAPAPSSAARTRADARDLDRRP